MSIVKSCFIKNRLSKYLSTFTLGIWLVLTTAVAFSAEAPELKPEANNTKGKPVVLIMGDSLSAAYGIDLKAGWVALLGQALAEGYDYKVINASVSGETTGGGLARLPALLDAHKPSVVVLELGGNDGLRGYPLNVMQKNLSQILDLSLKANAKVLLLGMKIPPNYGKRYTSQFEQVFATLANKYNVAFVPFFLEGVATNPELMQRDGIHPTEESQEQMMQNVLPTLKSLL